MALSPRLPEIRREPLDIAIASGIVLIGIPVLLAGLVAAGFYMYFIKLSPPVSIPEPQLVSEASSSHIYAADGSLIATLRGAHYRVPISIRQMPQHVKDAVVAAEDARFYQHSGVDARAVLRALRADFIAGAAVQGGSTITQQYVKNAYVGKERTWMRKIKEAQIASQLERTNSKQKILERYLNTVYFGRGAYGIEAAAKVYFDKGAKDLTASEAAQLVGLIPAPVRFSPNTQPSRAEDRRLDVISRMEQQGFLSGGEAQQARAERPAFKEAKPSEEVFKYPWFVDAVKRYLFHKYGATTVYNGGLEIHTSLDPRLQDLAEKAVKQALPAPTDPYASLVSLESGTGYVKAMVGGRNFEEEKYNIAIQGRRQPGSSFKPFVLVSALESGMLPGNTFSGPSTICITGWRPKCQVNNFDRAGFGRITLEQATINSVNTVFAQVVMRVGPKEVVATAKRMGVPGPRWLPRISGCRPTKEITCGTRIDAVPALALGSEEVTPLEMASAFGTLSARGVYREPKVVTKVVNSDGEVLEEGPARGRRALEVEIADNANAIMQKVITSGTGTRANIGRPVAGKTGTAQDFQNAWFVGYTPEVSTAVWVGFKERNRPLTNIRGVGRVTGGSFPAIIWSNYMKAALDSVPPSEFAEPLPLQKLELPHRPGPGLAPFPLSTFETKPLDEPLYSPPPTFDADPPYPSPNANPQPPAPGGTGLLQQLLGGKQTPPPSPTPSPGREPEPSPP
jgi:penicillin-binding protein 1A